MGNREGVIFELEHRGEERGVENYSISACGRPVDGGIYSWKPGREGRNDFMENGDKFSYGHAEYEVILGHLGKGVQEVAGNKEHELTVDTGDENITVSIDV